MPRQPKGSAHARRAIAAQAARLIAEDGLADYGAAKRKAARQLGFRESDGLPDNGEVEEALRTYQTLFQNDEQRDRLADMRNVALGVMEEFAAYHPSLAGAAWNGTATRGAPIDIDLFTDEQKPLEMLMINRASPFTTTDRPHFNKALQSRIPVFRFIEDGYDIRLSIFARADERMGFKPDANGQAERGTAADIRALLEHDDDPVARFLGDIR
jgi:hypothetical protein